jgi:hypothetical protein
VAWKRNGQSNPVCHKPRSMRIAALTALWLLSTLVMPAQQPYRRAVVRSGGEPGVRYSSYMLFLVRSIRDSFGPGVVDFISIPLLRPFTEASVASRRERAQQGDGGGFAQRRPSPSLSSFPAVPKCIHPSLLLFLLRQESETAALAQRTAVACASSLSSRTVFSGQSVVQLEPHTPSAQNSNRCQSVGVSRQLVSVRMS